MSIFPVGFGSRKKASGIPPINNSLRFRSAASAYLSRTPAVQGNLKTWTWSGWVKRGALATRMDVFTCGTGALTGGFLSVYFDTDDKLKIVSAYPATPTNELVWMSAPVFRDPAAWMHIHIICDTTQADQYSRILVYANNVYVGWSTFSPIPALNADLELGRTIPHNLGRFAGNNTSYLDGYLSRICFVDGAVRYAEEFGYTDADTGQWVSKSAAACKAIVDAGGTNSFMLDFDTVATLGNDYSAKNNDWTPNNISTVAGVTYDWMIDTPTNNFAVLNPLKSGITLVQNGNLTIDGNPTWASIQGTIALMDGVYWETTIGTMGDANFRSHGVARESATLANYLGFDLNGWGVNRNNANTVTGVLNNTGSTPIAGAPAISAGVVWMFAYKNGKLFWGQNGVWYPSGANPATETSPVVSGLSGLLLPAGSTYGTGVDHYNFGQRPFTYTPPSGYKALSTANLTSDDVIESGSFTGNANVNGPFIWCNGTPETLTINGNAVTWGTHADKLANGFKLRTASTSYNSTGTNNWTATILSPEKKSAFRNQRAKGNP